MTDAESQVAADGLGLQLRFSKSSDAHALGNALPLAADGVSSTRGRALAVLCSRRAVLGGVGPPAAPGSWHFSRGREAAVPVCQGPESPVSVT